MCISILARDDMCSYQKGRFLYFKNLRFSRFWIFSRAVRPPLYVVCMGFYARAYTHTHTRTHTHKHAHKCTYTHTLSLTHTHTYAYTHLYLHISLCMCLFLCLCQHLSLLRPVYPFYFVRFPLWFSPPLVFVFLFRLLSPHFFLCFSRYLAKR